MSGQMMGADFLPLLVSCREQVAAGTFLLELRDPAGGELPAFTPGSHLTVVAPNGARRNYSICSDPAQRQCYQLAIKRDSAGRGGSLSMCDDVAEGQLLMVSQPRNNFLLTERARKFLFVAGGIGITPILSMMRHLRHVDGAAMQLIYLTRNVQDTAFLRELQTEFAGQVTVHHDQGLPDQALDLWPLFEKPTNAHIYCCGPKGLMDGVHDMTGHWSSGTVHFESFGVDAVVHAQNTPFQVRLQRSGMRLQVGARQSILEVLRAQGCRVPSSCESGTCGSCKTVLLGGEPEHRDMVLADNEQSTHIMVCVSRARSAELLLDL